MNPADMRGQRGGQASWRPARHRQTPRGRKVLTRAEQPGRDLRTGYPVATGPRLWFCLWLVVLVFSPATPSLASVFNYLEGDTALRWALPNPDGLHTNIYNPRTKSIRYFVASDLYSATNAATELNAIHTSFGQWEAIPGTWLKFEFGGLADPKTGVNLEDNTNIVYWTKSGKTVNGGYDNIGNNTGLTYLSFFADDSSLAEADIVLNGTRYAWFTDIRDTNSTRQFVESTLLHEIGHFLGLEHSPAGGATMFWSGDVGVDAQAGLSAEEIAAARALYGRPESRNTWGALRGTVRLGQRGAYGAIVIAEDGAGNLMASTLTRADGAYELAGLPPGPCTLRVCPLDNPAERESLVLQRDISLHYALNSIDTDFQATTNFPARVAGGATNSIDLPVIPGKPRFNITLLRVPSRRQAPFDITSVPVFMQPGQSNYFIGVLSSNLPSSGATLAITGDGITLGPPQFSVDTFGHGYIFTTIGVASNATPGLRSFLVQQGTNRAYANGFLEIQPPVRDDNFDGLEDLWQRDHFPVFTAPEASPPADPDGDGFSNLREYRSNTNPSDSRSAKFQVLSVRITANGAEIISEAGAGKRHQLLSRDAIGSGAWQPIGPPVTAITETVNFTDPGGTNANRYYRVQLLP